MIKGNESKVEWMKKIYGFYMFFIGVFGQLVYFAQAYKIFSTHRAADVSLFGFIAGFIAATSWLIYGIILKDRPLIVANTAACLGSMVVLIGILIYG